MKLKVKLLIGVGAIFVVGYLIFKNKKTKELKIKNEEQYKVDFTEAVKKEANVEAVAMNIDLINEKKAKDILNEINALNKEYIKMPVHTALYKPALELKKQINDLKLELKILGYRTNDSYIGSTLVRL